jgi:glycosyltransferase involved in cell wall biosynthesis
MLLNELGVKTRFLPNGVDTEKFSPVSERTKEKLREKYDIANQFIILHVGHIKNERNIRVLGDLVEGNNLVVIVASTSTKVDEDLIRYLEEKGVLIWKEYFENIHEIYNLSDCYVFPVTKANASIEIPLSVLEAMSCNLPVVSTNFGGLVDFLEEGDGLFFVDNEKGFIKKIEMVKNGPLCVETRKKVLPLSWGKIGETLDRIYEEIGAEA